MTDDLVQFLRGRLDQDEQIARARWNREGATSEKFHGTPYDPVRVFADLAAKRQLIDVILGYEAKIDGEWGCCHGPDQIAAGQCSDTQPGSIPALRLLALPYRDHENYQSAWAPEA